MIDNPLPDQVMEEMSLAYKSDQLNQACFDHGLEIAKHYNVHSEFQEYFAEWYQDYMTQNPHLFDPTCIHLDSDYIDDWWEEHGENLIEDKWGELGNSGPYDIDPTPQYLYDDTGGEPPISAEERNHNSLDSKKESHGHRYS